MFSGYGIRVSSIFDCFDNSLDWYFWLYVYPSLGDGVYGSEFAFGDIFFGKYYGDDRGVGGFHGVVD